MNISIEKSTTTEAALKYEDCQFRFVFIDADHSYEATKADFENWSPLVGDQGIIAFHDSDTPGVKRFLEELKWKKLGQVQSLSWYGR